MQIGQFRCVIITLLFNWLTLTQSHAQTDSVQTLLGGGWNSTHFFFGPAAEVQINHSRFSEPVSLFLGGQSGWIINRRLVFGITGYGKVTPSTYYGTYTYEDDATGQQMTENDRKMRVSYGFGGVILGVILHPGEALHIQVGTVIGGGTANEYIVNENGSHGTTFQSPGFFMMEPKLGVELNLTRYLRFELGVGYRYISAIRFESLSTGELSGFTLGMGFKLGIY